MKIYFCDGCNQSIPLSEIQVGRVTAIQGKMFCSTCIPPGAIPSPAAPRDAAGGGQARTARGGLLVLLVLVLFAWTAWRDRGLFFDRASAPIVSPEAAPARNLLGEVQELSEALVQSRADGDRRSKEILSLRAEFESLRETDAALRRAIESQKDLLDRVSRTQTEAARFHERMEISVARLERVEVRLDALSDAVAVHAARFALSDAWAAAAPQAGAEAAFAPAVDPVRLALVEELRRLLLSPDPGVRFEGVDRIGTDGYRELAPDLVPLLRDTDMFVRMHAMQILGNFGHEEAVPALFDVLEDDNATIRKTAAENLVRLTGYDPGFDPRGSAGDRARAVKRWRDWYAAR